MAARTISAFLLVLCIALGSGRAHAQPPMRPPASPHPLIPFTAVMDPGQQCRTAIRAAERAAGLPDQLMAAIAHVESGRPDAEGKINPWPWTINVEGEGHIYDSKAEAIAAVRAFQAHGARSIDVGCMQVNLMFHPDAFQSLDQAFDPTANAIYAAHFLTVLYASTHNWEQATAQYHSATPDIGADYQRKVAAVLPQELRQPRDAGTAGNVWSNNVWTANVWNSGGHAAPVPPAAALAQPGSVLAQSGSPIPPATPTPFGNAGGGFMLSNRAATARILPAASNVVGRGLEAYRAAPIPVASRAVPPRAPL